MEKKDRIDRSHSAPISKQTQPINQATEQNITDPTWQGRLLNGLKEIKNKLARSFFSMFPNQNTKILSNDMGFKKYYIKKLYNKGFDTNEAARIFKQKLAKYTSPNNFADQINDIPQKKYFDKYQSQAAITQHVGRALAHIKKLGYNSVQYRQTIHSLLNECNNFAEFENRVNDLPTLQDYHLGYKSASAVQKDKNAYLYTLAITLGYDINTAEQMLAKIYEEENDKNNISTRIINTPAVNTEKIIQQGYSDNKDYEDTFNEYAKTLEQFMANEQQVHELVREVQEKATSKLEFISNITEKITGIAEQPFVEELLETYDTLKKILKIYLIKNHAKNVDCNGEQVTMNLSNTLDHLKELVNMSVTIEQELTETIEKPSEECEKLINDHKKQFTRAFSEIRKMNADMFNSDLSNNDNHEPSYAKYYYKNFNGLTEILNKLQVS